MSLTTRLSRSPLAVTALIVGALKACQFTVDRTPQFFDDSGAFIGNAFGDFVSFRSYVYGWLIRLVAVPAASLEALVACQVLLSAASAWLVAAVLIRHFAVRPWIALACAVVFACDPMQIVHERLVMAETAALCAMALLLLVYLEYLRSSRLLWLAAAALAGVLVVALRFAFLPPVLAMAAALPFVSHLAAGGRSVPGRSALSVVMAVCVSASATFACHTGYRYLTGYLGGTEPLYHDRVGLFQVASVAPLLRPEDASVPWVSDLIVTQESSAIPLSRRGWRVRHLWDEGGFVDRLTSGFGGDRRAAEREAGRLYRQAVARDPLGFFRLGVESYARYWYDLGRAPLKLRAESGLGPVSLLVPQSAADIAERFGLDTTGLHQLESASRRYYILAWWWCVVLLAVPPVGLLLIRLMPAHQRERVVLLALWNVLVILAISFGTVETVYRYLHPFSFTGALALGLIGEAVLSRRPPHP